jgi:hypothetical protein
MLADTVALNAPKAGRGFRAQGAASLLQALAHDPVQDQRDEADAGVGFDALGQAVEGRGDLDLSDLSTLKPRSMSARAL